MLGWGKNSEKRWKVMAQGPAKLKNPVVCEAFAKRRDLTETGQKTSRLGIAHFGFGITVSHIRDLEDIMKSYILGSQN